MALPGFRLSNPPDYPLDYYRRAAWMLHCWISRAEIVDPKFRSKTAQNHIDETRKALNFFNDLVKAKGG